MTDLKLFPGPRLDRRHWSDDNDSGVGAWNTHDVTARANEYLFSDVAVDPAVTLADVFALVGPDPVMQMVFRQDFVKELCEEAKKGPVVRADEEPWEKIEYLELYQAWSHDTATHEFHGAGRFQLHGVGILQEADVSQDGYVTYKKGERINWGVSLSPVRELLHLPVRVRQDVEISEADMDAKAYGKIILKGSCPRITLGTFIHEVLWELSWHGSPAESEKVGDDLRSQMDEVNAGTAELVSGEDVFESLGFTPDKVVYAQFFENSELFTRHEIYSALHALEDDEPAQAGLGQGASPLLTLRAGFGDLPGRTLRKLIREARHLDRKSKRA